MQRPTMQVTSARLRYQILYGALLLCILTGTWLLRAPLHQMPLERDEGAYALIARAWASDLVPYRDLFDHKPPLVFLVYGLSRYLPGEGAEPIRILATLYLLLSGLALLALAGELYGRWVALTALPIFFSYMSSLRFQGITFNSEAVMILPAISACWLLTIGIRRRRLAAVALAGIAVGLVILAKPVGLLLVPASLLGLAISPWPWRRRLAAMGLLLSGMLLVALAFLAYFAAKTALQPAYYALIEYNRIYIEESKQRFALLHLWRIWRPMLVLFVPALLGLMFSLRSPTERTHLHYNLLTWAGALLASAVASLRDYPHYYQVVLPALSLWAAVLCAACARFLARRLAQPLLGTAIAATLLVALTLPPLSEIWPLRALTAEDQIQAVYGREGSYYFWSATKVADYLNAHTDEGEAIFVWAAEPEIYYLARRRPATRFIYDYPLNRLPDAREETITQLRGAPPPFIVTYSGVRPPGFASIAVDHNYRRVVTIGGFDLFSREPVFPTADTQPPAPPPTSPPALAGATQPLRLDRQEYGITAELYYTDRERALTLVGNAGLDWVRQPISWKAIEYAQASYDWSEVDEIVALARLHQVKLLLSISGAPAWARADGTDGIPDKPRLFGDFLEVLTKRYRGKIAAYEIWSGQNLASNNGGFVRIEDADRYAGLLMEAYRRIRAVDPAAYVLIGPAAPTGVNDPHRAIDDLSYYRRLYSYQGGIIKDYFDAQAVHLETAANPPETLWPDAPSAAKGWNGHSSFYFRHVEHIRSLMEDTGMQDHQIWITRYGWATANNTPGYEYGHQVSLEQQAEYVLGALRRTRQHYPWVAVSILWNLNQSILAAAKETPNAVEASFSVLNANWSPRPSYTVLQGFVHAVRQAEGR